MGMLKLKLWIRAQTDVTEQARIKAERMDYDSPEFRTWVSCRLRLDGMLEAERLMNEPDEED